MSDESVSNVMQRMKLLFFGFAILLPLGIVVALVSPYVVPGIAIATVGGLLGIIFAFTPCPCCSKLSGVFFKYVVGGVFPMGFCFHCGKSYVSGKDCGKDF